MMAVHKKVLSAYKATGGLLVVLTILTGSIFYVIFGGFNQPQQTQKTELAETASVFRIDLEFDTVEKKLFFRNIKSLREPISIDQGLSSLSSYELVLSDQDKKQVYRTKIHINEKIFIDASPGENITIKTEDVPKKISSAIYVPYYPEAASLLIFKNSKILTTASIPFEQRKFAKAPPSSVAETAGTGGYKIAIIGDGFDSGTFNAHVNTFISAVGNQPPFGDVFEFVPYEGAPSPGCTGRILDCIQSGAMQVAIQAAKAATGANGVVVLVNGGGTSAAMTGTGPAVINVNSNFVWNAKHEFLGHMIGDLNDRYDNTILGGGGSIGATESNCSSNPNGISWWPAAGSTGVYPKCQGASLFSPFPHDPACTKGGTKDTIMSNCPGASTGFDSVETYWILNFIIPNLQNGGGGGGGGAPPPTGNNVCPAFTTCDNVDLLGSDFYWYVNPDPALQNATDCKIACEVDPVCRSWTFVKDSKTCFEKNAIPQATTNNNTVSGAKQSFNLPTSPIPPPSEPSITQPVPTDIGGGGEPKPLSINISVDKSIYNIGEAIKLCFGASKTAYLKIREVAQNGTVLRSFPQVNIFGGGQGCATGVTAIAPAGAKCMRLEALSSQTGGSVIATKEACYTVVDPNPTTTISPTVSLQPTATPTNTLTPSATKTPTPSTSPGATATPIPSPTSTFLSFQVLMEGIGINVAPNRGFNPNPKRPTRALEYELLNTQNQVVKSGTAQVTGRTSGIIFDYIGETSLDGEFNDALYTVRMRLDNTLWKKTNVNRIDTFHLQSGAQDLIAGDINRDNILDLSDYNAILSCYGARICSNKIIPDLNDDGVVDEKDINIFYSALARRTGD